MSDYIEKATKQAVESIREATKQAERDLGQMTKAIWESTAAAIRDLEVHAEAMDKVDQAPGSYDHFFMTEIDAGDAIGDDYDGIPLSGAVIRLFNGDQWSIGAGSAIDVKIGPQLKPGRRYRMDVAFIELPTCGWEGCEQEMNHHGHHDPAAGAADNERRRATEPRPDAPKTKEEYIAAVTPLEATQADNGLPTMEVPKKFAKGIVVSPPREQEDLCEQCKQLSCEASRSEIPLVHCAYCWELVTKKDLTGENNVWCSSCAKREAKNSARITETKAFATHTGRRFDDPPDIQRGTRLTCGVCHHLYFLDVDKGSTLTYCEVCVLDPSMEKAIVVNPTPKRCDDSYHAPECDSHGLNCTQHEVPITPFKDKNPLRCKTCHEAIYFDLTPAGVAAPQCCSEACTKKWIATIKRAHRDLSKGRCFCNNCGAAHEMKSDLCAVCFETKDLMV